MASSRTGRAGPGRHLAPLGWLMGLTVLTTALTTAWAQSDPLCPYIGGCEYEAPAFSIRVVDQETGQPLPDVHAMAVWNQYGPHGNKGPVMALDAVSDADGVISFPAWGKVRGGSTGLIPGQDPGVSLYRPGYRTLVIVNPTPTGRPLNTQVHAFLRKDTTYALSRFQGSLAETLVELRKAARPFTGTGASRYDPAAIRQVYINRWIRVRAAAAGLPQENADVAQFLWGLNEGIELFQRGAP